MSQMVHVSELPWQQERVAKAGGSLAQVLIGAMLVLDLIICSGSLVLVYWVLTPWPSVAWSSWTEWATAMIASLQPIWPLVWSAPLIRLGALWYFGLYRVYGEFPLMRDLWNIIKATTVGSIILMLIAFLSSAVQDAHQLSLLRGVLLLDGLFVLYGLLVVRFSVRMVQIVARRRGMNIIPAIIIGDGEMAQVCLEEIVNKPRLGYQVVGVVTSADRFSIKGPSPLPIIGTVDSLPELIRRYGVREVLITDSKLDPQVLFETIMRSGHSQQVRYHVIPNLFNCLPQKTDFAQIGVLPMVKLFEEPITGLNRYLKRAIDIVAASLLMLLTSPLWLLIAVLIKRESPGPVFYKQERVGMDGRVFVVNKFRSMRADSDDRAHREAVRQMLAGGNHGGNQGSEDKPLYGKVINDDRITKVGRFIRRFSLDELPQLINVLRGEMSLVGPRPLPVYQVEGTNAYQRARHHIKPGLTGLWQVSGRNRLPFEEMIRLDIFYIENWSLWLDLKIILKTPAVMLFGQTED